MQAHQIHHLFRGAFGSGHRDTRRRAPGARGAGALASYEGTGATFLGGTVGAVLDKVYQLKIDGIRVVMDLG